MSPAAARCPHPSRFARAATHSRYSPARSHRCSRSASAVPVAASSAGSSHDGVRPQDRRGAPGCVPCLSSGPPPASRARGVARHAARQGTGAGVGPCRFARGGRLPVRISTSQTRDHFVCPRRPAENGTSSANHGCAVPSGQPWAPSRKQRSGRAARSRPASRGSTAAFEPAGHHFTVRRRTRRGRPASTGASSSGSARCAAPAA